MSNILYSIITPVYNRADCVLRCLESVSMQLSANVGIEHIIVDDGSKDESYSIIYDYAIKHPHVRLYKFEINKGTNAARNKAISEAKGLFCILLDSDDYFTKDAINFIENVRHNNQYYSHFLFTPSDRKEEFDHYFNQHINQKDFSYIDFLSGKITGDFIHVISTDLFLKYPFYEKVRIQEELTFLKIYREEKRILFTNHIVTIRERLRHDSVTKETLRVNDNHILLNKEGLLYYINNFKKDLIANHLRNILNIKYSRLLEDTLLLSEYKEAKKVIYAMKENNIHASLIIRAVYSLRIGWMYKIMLKYYLKFKYRNW